MLAENKDGGNMAAGLFFAFEILEYISQNQIAMFGRIMNALTRGPVVTEADDRSGLGTQAVGPLAVVGRDG